VISILLPLKQWQCGTLVSVVGGTKKGPGLNHYQKGNQSLNRKKQGEERKSHVMHKSYGNNFE